MEWDSDQKFGGNLLQGTLYIVQYRKVHLFKFQWNVQKRLTVVVTWVLLCLRIFQLTVLFFYEHQIF
jgi:hypothetical protein